MTSVSRAAGWADMSRPKPWEAWQAPFDPAEYARKLEERRLAKKAYDAARYVARPRPEKNYYPKRGGKYS